MASAAPFSNFERKMTAARKIKICVVFQLSINNVEVRILRTLELKFYK